jgi:hypothetical protein
MMVMSFCEFCENRHKERRAFVVKTRNFIYTCAVWHLAVYSALVPSALCCCTQQRIKCAVFIVAETECVYCAVRAECLLRGTR